MKKLITSLLLLFSVFSIAQKTDFDWLMGGKPFADPSDTTHGITHLNFNQNELEVYREATIKMEFAECNLSVCDSDGKLIFYSNCEEIFNANHETMENSEGFNDYPFHLGYDGLPTLQGILGFQSVSNPDQYYLVHSRIDYKEFNGEYYGILIGIYYTKIDMEGDGGLGMVVEKDVTIVEDTLNYGMLTATRHANGRDWWILSQELNSNRCLRVLLDPTGFHVLPSQAVGETVSSIGLGQACFSPDGSRYVRNMMLGGTADDDYIDIYDFDRCTGLLSNHVRFPYGSGVLLGGGAAISPNNRFMYAAHRNHVYQYDLWASDVIGSKDTVAVYDGFLDQGWNATSFYMAQAAPDGKIYINTTVGTHYLHIVENPNEKGAACNLRQRGVFLPTINFYSIPNFPNYRLGPLDGSPCDTLGLDNHPVAFYRYDQDTTDYLSVRFTDLSYYEPTEWFWDFGDHTTSNNPNPIHEFPSDGTYEVCLTVSNQYDTSSFCRTLIIGTGISATTEAQPLDLVSVFPNPASTATNFRLGGDYLPRAAMLRLYSATGQPVRSQRLLAGWSVVGLEGLAKGMYFWEVRDNDRVLGTGKLVKVE
ncbi:MAG: PKD domain-containing protein [Saprospiraceae bacterium]|nr:PKD domain-containing protein [Saprospiraceae bacterium]